MRDKILNYAVLLVISTLFTVLSFNLQAKKQRLSVAIDHTPPYAFIDERGRPSGMIIDVMQQLSSRLPYDFEYIECPWVRCVKLVESGEVDLLPGITRTRSREQVFVFIEPPFIARNEVDQFRFYSKKQHISINSYSDLFPLNIGTLRGSSYNEQFDNDERIIKTTFVDIKTMFEALDKNRIDAFIYYDDTVVPLLKEFDPSNKIRASQLGLATKQHAYIVMSKHSKHLAKLENISMQLQALIDEGKVNQIFKRYGL